MKKFTQSIDHFIKKETSSSIVLLAITILTLAIANIGFYEEYFVLLHEKLTFAISDFKLSKSLILWINDGLMAIFFFLIGLEIKREIMVGELSSLKKASLPIVAAIGGMVFPVLFFFLLNGERETVQGWAIPMATDIAFTLGILKLLGNRIPFGLKVFLTAFAIVDDLGAILIIAFFYSSGIQWDLVLYAMAIFGFLVILNNLKLYSKYIFFIAGVVIWVLFLKSGIHATIAGVLVAFSIPIRKNIKIAAYQEEMDGELSEFKSISTERNTRYVLTKKQMDSIDKIESLTEQIQSPLQRLEHGLHGWVAFLIMPIFAFANAGVLIDSNSFSNFNYSMVIAASLVLGNFVGIGLLSYIAIKLKIAKLPKNTSFAQLLFVGLLGGVGFTMSLFITNLAFENQTLIDASKIGILIGSFVAGTIGYIALRILSKPQEEEPN